MIAKVMSAIPYGYTGRLIAVEGDLSQGLPTFNLVGMASKSVSEARERVRSAIRAAGLSFPSEKLTLNLAPAELAKEGVFLDLPIALNILILSGQLLPSNISDSLFVGELSLDGTLRPVRGIINIAEAAVKQGYQRLFLPFDNLAQASLISGLELIGVKTLKELFLHLKQQRLISPPPNVVENNKTDVSGPFLDHIYGQATAKRALTIAVAGHHNLLLSGPPGSGKTLLARTAVNLLPPLTPTEQIEITKLYSLAGLADQVITERPFRTPHHTSSFTAIVGGSAHAAPGEISLAHRGVLFLDELPEFPRSTLESLRQPLEDRQITITRANHKSTYPADFMLIATMNPCPCGYLGDPTHECICTPTQITQYSKKLSGPLLDRIDLSLTVPRVDNADLLKNSIQNDSTPNEQVFKATPPADSVPTQHNVVKNNITGAIARQRARYQDQTTYNSSLSSHQVATLLRLSPAATQLLQAASSKLQLSARAYFKVIKVAQTIADLEGADIIQPEHLSEALTYRLG